MFRSLFILNVALCGLGASPVLSASPAKAVVSLQILAAEPQGKAGAPLPEKLVQLSLPFLSEKGCASKIFFPKSTFTRLDLADETPGVLFGTDVDSLIYDSQTPVQRLFKKMPDVKELQSTARGRLAKQTISPEWARDATRKSEQARLETIVAGTATAAMFVMDGNTTDAQTKEKLTELLKVKAGTKGAAVSAPADVEAVRLLIAKAMCADDLNTGKNIVVYLARKLPQAVQQSPKPQKPLSPKDADCWNVPLTGKKLCPRDAPATSEKAKK